MSPATCQPKWTSVDIFHLKFLQFQLSNIFWTITALHQIKKNSSLRSAQQNSSFFLSHIFFNTESVSQLTFFRIFSRLFHSLSTFHTKNSIQSHIGNIFTQDFHSFSLNFRRFSRVFSRCPKSKPNYVNYVHGNCAQKGRKNIIWVRKKMIHQQTTYIHNQPKDSTCISPIDFIQHLPLCICSQHEHTNATGRWDLSAVLCADFNF